MSPQDLLNTGDEQSKRFVAFFDILGFSSLVENDPGRVRSVLSGFVSRARTTKNFNSDFGLLGYSDTIALYARRAGNECVLFDDIVTLARELFIACLVAKIPVRGAITYDTFHVEKSTDAEMNLFWGSALVRANKIEKTIKAVALCMLPEAALACTKSVDGVVNAYPCDFRIWEAELNKDCVTREALIWVNPFSRIANLSEAYTIHEAYSDFDPQIADEISAYRFLEEENAKPHNPDVHAKYAVALDYSYRFLAAKGTADRSRIDEIHGFNSEVVRQSGHADSGIFIASPRRCGTSTLAGTRSARNGSRTAKAAPSPTTTSPTTTKLSSPSAKPSASWPRSTPSSKPTAASPPPSPPPKTSPRSGRESPADDQGTWWHHARGTSPYGTKC